jgi:hypothetical protein
MVGVEGEEVGEGLDHHSQEVEVVLVHLVVVLVVLVLVVVVVGHLEP